MSLPRPSISPPREGYNHRSLGLNQNCCPRRHRHWGDSHAAATTSPGGSRARRRPPSPDSCLALPPPPCRAPVWTKHPKLRNRVCLPCLPDSPGAPEEPRPVPSLCRPRCAPQAAVGAGTQLCSSSSPLCVLPRGPQAAQDGLSVAPHWLVLPCAGNATNFGLISLVFFPCRPLFIEHNTTRERTANKNFVESHQDFANNDIWKIEKKKKKRSEN